MKFTQNERILQIKNETLEVGIDIGKETHCARSFDHRGIELVKLLRFSNMTIFQSRQIDEIITEEKQAL